MTLPITYIDQITEQFSLAVEHENVLLYGENIDTGSKIGGLTRSLKANSKSKILNVGNCELTHCGLGFGILLDGGKAVLFVKQLDFMLLGLDQICNTFNFIRAFLPRDKWGSFTIVAIVCDQGYQGPQSSFNGASDFASIANVPVYCLNASEDVCQIISNKLTQPGFRIMCVSQRFFKNTILRADAIAFDNQAIFKFMTGNSVTIISFNFSLRESFDIADRLSKAGATPELFHVNFVPNLNLDSIFISCLKTGRLMVVDDSKSVNKFSDHILVELSLRGIVVKLLQFNRRVLINDNYGANEDRLVIDFEKALNFIA